MLRASERRQNNVGPSREDTSGVGRFSEDDIDCQHNHADIAGEPQSATAHRSAALTSPFIASRATSRWIAFCKERLANILVSQSFQYKPIEMGERSVGLNESCADEVQPRNTSTRHLAGDEGNIGAEFVAVEGDPTAVVERDGSGMDFPRVPPFDEDELAHEEMRTLRKVSDTLPWSAFLVAVIELCERFTYYGLSGPFQNYIQNSYHDPRLPGAIGLGEVSATGLTNFFQLWCYVTPILGAVVSDQYLGKYNTILYFAFVYLAGILVLVCTSLPAAIEHGVALGGLIIAMIVIGLGTGGIKSNVSPLIAEQYRGTTQTIRILKSGEKVIVDPAVTIQRIYMIFYLCINLGSLSSIVTTKMEQRTGFWTAYLLCFCMFILGIVVLVAGKKSYVVRPPTGSVIPNAFKAMWIGLKNKGNMDMAKYTYQETYGSTGKAPCDDQFIDELKRTLIACRVFVFYPIYWLVYSQMLNNFISQAGTMELHGIPNDILQNIDSLTIILLIPIMDRGFYPLLRRFGIDFRPIARITMGFIFAAFAMAYAAIVQQLIYNAAPCYNAPLVCPAANQAEPNHVHVAVQAPAYLFIGISEIFASVTGLEYAFTKAPASMKSFVMSVFLLQSAFGSALGIALAPAAVDPKLVWMYSVLCVASLATACLFWFCFRRRDTTGDRVDALQR